MGPARRAGRTEAQKRARPEEGGGYLRSGPGPVFQSFRQQLSQLLAICPQPAPPPLWMGQCPPYTRKSAVQKLRVRLKSLPRPLLPGPSCPGGAVSPASRLFYTHTHSHAHSGWRTYMFINIHGHQVRVGMGQSSPEALHRGPGSPGCATHLLGDPGHRI